MDANWQKPDPDLATTTVPSNSTETTTPHQKEDANRQMPDPDLATSAVPSNSTETTTPHQIADANVVTNRPGSSD
jgi:hypothetical protein